MTLHLLPLDSTLGCYAYLRNVHQRQLVTGGIRLGWTCSRWTRAGKDVKSARCRSWERFHLVLHYQCGRIGRPMSAFMRRLLANCAPCLEFTTERPRGPWPAPSSDRVNECENLSAKLSGRPSHETCGLHTLLLLHCSDEQQRAPTSYNKATGVE